MSPSPSPLPDLTNRTDIVRLVDAFYERVREDARLGPIFNEVAQVQWATHLPKMYDFWETVLFGSGGFRGNPIVTHARLVPIADMSRASFDHWLGLFRETVTARFAGPNAQAILRNASDMANVIHARIHNLPDARFDPANLTPEQRARYAAYRGGTPNPDDPPAHPGSC